MRSVISLARNPLRNERIEAAMSIVHLIAILLLSLAPAMAQQPFRPAGYANAAQSFEQWTPDQRIKVQLHLPAAGFWPAVPNEQFNGRIFKAIQDFQSANGLPATGVLVPEQIEKLIDSSMPNFWAWDFKAIRHPERGRTIWVPLGLGLVPAKTAEGLAYNDPKGRFSLTYNFFRTVSIDSAYAYLLETYAKQNRQIHFKVMRNDFFVISSSENGRDFYTRYHRDGQGSLGVNLAWNNANGNVNGERIATIVSGALWSAMTGARFTEIPSRQTPKVEVSINPPALSPPQVSTPIQQQKEQEKPKISAKGTSGTGFFVSSAGYVVTNAHVVGDCSLITVHTDSGKSGLAQVMGRDERNDLAVLKVDLPAPRSVALRIGVKLGEPVAAFGFPLTDVLASSGNFTMGNVTALAGLGDDTRHVQTSTPVQPGNSGGPLLDHSGNLVGVISYKLDALKAAVASGDIPQNVNFAVKSSILASFLESYRIAPAVSTAGPLLSAVELAEQAKALSVFIQCR